MIYYLYPPFFVVPEESNFSEAWESFCCKLINLDEKTDEVYRREPPEQGIDLYFPRKRMAYQCKSIESGKSGDLRPDKVIASIRAAKAAQANLDWRRYVLCTNVDITGSAETAIRKELPEIILRPRSYWLKLCEKIQKRSPKEFPALVNYSGRENLRDD